jgi:mannose-6-phosphate isomerase-like protein (cupin superfamily)
MPNNQNGCESLRCRPDSIAACPTLQDVFLLQRLLAAGAVLEDEHCLRDDYLNHVIRKPWGHEYRIYADSFYDCWELAIAPGAQTSSHCHPRKETALLCLSGLARVHLLGRSLRLGPGEHLYILPGTFHATENIGRSVLDLIELETPRNKLDLVRASDKYGRQRQGYERHARHGELGPLIDTQEIVGARIRELSARGEYRFSLSSIAPETVRGGSAPLFAVGLVLGSSAFYLTIERQPHEARRQT